MKAMQTEPGSARGLVMVMRAMIRSSQEILN